MQIDFIRCMNRLVAISLSIILLSGCALAGSGFSSWEDLTTTVATTPQELRLAKHIDAQMSQRFLVAPNTHIHIDNPHEIEPEILTAAYQGLSQVYPRSGDEDVAIGTIRVRVSWPNKRQASPPTKSWGLSLLGRTRLPQASSVTTFPIQVTDADGQLITQADIKISPPAWQDGWPQPALVRATFTRFAERLRDG